MSWASALSLQLLLIFEDNAEMFCRLESLLLALILAVISTAHPPEIDQTGHFGCYSLETHRYVCMKCVCVCVCVCVCKATPHTSVMSNTSEVCGVASARDFTSQCHLLLFYDVLWCYDVQVLLHDSKGCV